MEKLKKAIILVGDGMADWPRDDLQQRTVLEAAHTPHMDRLAGMAMVGLAATVPEGMNPGSDTANLSIFGYNPRQYYTGRAPLEALNLGIGLAPDDVAFRCNLVSIHDGIMHDFTADHIDSAFGRLVMNELQRELGDAAFSFHPGVSYRNILVWKSYPGTEITRATPPHDISGRQVAGYGPQGAHAAELAALQQKAAAVIASSSRISRARSQYQGSPDAIWLWGGGRRPALEPFLTRFGLHGATISAVDLIHGIGRAAGFEPLHVPGATGYIDTDYAAKTAACLAALENHDLIFLHIESPDESGHEGNLAHKLQYIEDIDFHVVGPLLEYVTSRDDTGLLVMPDHATPLEIRTHSAEPVPFMLYRPGMRGSVPDTAAAVYSERAAAATGLRIEDASHLVGMLING
jgi:2,3-bisphosphoglycerate-independent phosphoglycerate mutase